jgi:hypothetical protein
MSSFLRTHLAGLREQFSTAALILSVVALVAALAGGAIAANGARSSKTKVVKGPPGKPGKEGAQGPEGKQGPLGQAGPTGPAGPAGGAGKAIVVGSAPSCEEGGTSFEVEGSPGTRHVVCNGIEGPPGAKGEEGEEGEPGENGQTGFTETLPSGQTETGTWISPPIVEVSELYSQVAISFSIPTTEPVENWEYVNREVQEAHSSATCPGSVEAPKAAGGFLCIYQGATENPTETEELRVSAVRHPGRFTLGAGVAGAVLYVAYEGPSSPEVTRISGTWAVTAP